MKFLKQIVLASALAVASLQGIAPGGAAEVKAGNIVIGHPWSRQSPMAADVAAGFMTLTNAGQEDDRLLKVTSSISGNVQLHDMQMTGDVMKMVELPDGIAIPAGATVELKPRALHVMFLGLANPPKAGESFTGTLTFERAGTVEVNFDVMDPGANMN